MLVQAAPTVAETEFLLELSKDYDFIAGVVGWLDLESPDFPKQFARFRRHRRFVGIRPMLQDLEDDRWILRPQVKRNIAILSQQDFPLDLLIYPRHLPHIEELLQEFPTLRAVVDHAAKPDIRGGVLEPWKSGIARIASFPKVMCKLSGLITEADHDNWTPDDLKPYVHHVIDVFGVDRVMFGSDWPVCLLAGSYRDVIEALTATLPEELSEDDRSKIFGKNAARFYQLGKQESEVAEA